MTTCDDQVLFVLAVDLVYVSALKSTDLLQRWLPKMGIDEAPFSLSNVKEVNPENGRR